MFLNFLEEKKKRKKTLKTDWKEIKLKKDWKRKKPINFNGVGALLLSWLLVDFFETAEKREMRSGGIRKK